MSDFVVINRTDDAIVYRVAHRMKTRSEKGLETYGVSMERKDLTLHQWIDHAIEEALDFAIYLEKIKSEIKNG